ncbi:hypothetical protein KVT40_004209 [Elsinoe batatas]|uniref:DNA 3'-5' helicase n=1 Tax=Elsinoe batatas TaxID=2601811 RepID=A0A8K0PFX5_9PEZI|nr:hypothetical protein KVT40_004209 [Elsinoe batatas]
MSQYDRQWAYGQDISDSGPEYLSIDEYDRRLPAQHDYHDDRSQRLFRTTRVSLPTRSYQSTHPQSIEQSPHFAAASLPRDRTIGVRRHMPTTPSISSSSIGEVITSSPTYAAGHAITKKRKYNHPTPHQSESMSTPVVRGIPLHSPHELPDRFKAIFPYEFFNAVQSRCFTTLYQSDENFVLSAPTGSGKTVAFELAICRLTSQQPDLDFKVVYMAPTKALCTERTRDWQRKFSSLRINVEEVTGDTPGGTLQSVKNAHVIVTTSERWDSLTRKWKDHERLVRLIRLLLIDEVHILGQNRGAALEAVVSRMKSVGSNIRFVAVSATVPNVQDVATWLGRDQDRSSSPAALERFGEDFRPVRLKKHVIGYDLRTSNDYQFDAAITKSIPDVIQKYSGGKPIIIFCMTRKSCGTTANLLAEWYVRCKDGEKPWTIDGRPVVVGDRDLQATLQAGIAIHHAALSAGDRSAIESGYLAGSIKVICCTTTLAVGVNLPCHMVVVKGTATIAEGGKLTRELSDMDILQMMGRAGRPQFDTDAIAVIMTKTDRAGVYERMVNCQETLESRLHVNLIEHLNSEIGLGTIKDFPTAISWLSSTFLYVRLKVNPDHYQLGDSAHTTYQESLDDICRTALDLLETNDLIDVDTSFVRQNDFGAAMARYYISFETMKSVVTIAPRPKISELLSILCSAHDLCEIRFRAKEKQLFKQVNEASSIKFPIKVNLSVQPQKVSLIIQAVLGGVELLAQDDSYKFVFAAEKNKVFELGRRLIRCIIDCQISKGDAIGIRNSLMLARSLGAEVWDDLPLHLQQLQNIGPVSVRKLIGANIRNVEQIIACPPAKIEMALGRNPPFGITFIDQVKAFPRLRLAVRQVGQPVVRFGEPPSVTLRADISFANERPPTHFSKQPIYVTFLAERSDGRSIDFWRDSAYNIGRGIDKIFRASFLSFGQSVICSIACDEIAGTSVEATIEPDIPASAFRGLQPVQPNGPRALIGPTKLAGGGAKIRSREHSGQTHITQSTDWGDDNISDVDLAAMELQEGFQDIDEIDAHQGRTSSEKHPADQGKSDTISHDEYKPVKLPNGNWRCNHTCKNKTACNHKCCIDGLAKPPRPPKARKERSSKQSKEAENKAAKKKGQTQLTFQPSPEKAQPKYDVGHPEQVDLTQTDRGLYQQSLIRPLQQAQSVGRLQNLHNSTSTGGVVVSSRLPLRSVTQHHPRFQAATDAAEDISDFEDFDEEELSHLGIIVDVSKPNKIVEAAKALSPIDDEPPLESSSSLFMSTRRPAADDGAVVDSDEEMLDAALIGAEDSFSLSSPRKGKSITAEAFPDDQPTSYQDPAVHSTRLDEDNAVGLADDQLPCYGTPDHDDTNMGPQAEECEAAVSTEAAPKDRDSIEREELKKFLWQEFGDSVELI